MYCLDFEAFQYEGDYLIKELCIMRICNFNKKETIFHNSFTQPFHKYELNAKDFKTNCWLSENRHHIPWTSGNLDESPFSIIRRYLPTYATVLVRGDQKIEYLRHNIDTINFVPITHSLQSNKFDCCEMHDKSTFMCSYAKLLNYNCYK